MSISDKRVCPDCGSKDLKLCFSSNLHGTKLINVPVTHCNTCNSDALTAISRQVYMYYCAHSSYSPTEYESAAMFALQEHKELKYDYSLHI